MPLLDTKALYTSLCSFSYLLFFPPHIFFSVLLPSCSSLLSLHVESKGVRKEGKKRCLGDFLLLTLAFFLSLSHSLYIVFGLSITTL